MPPFKHIALLVDASREYGRGICRGVANFCETRDDWIVIPHERPEIHALPDWFKSSPLDGVIAYIPNTTLMEELRDIGVPIVDVHGRCHAGDIPVVESDPVALVSLAVDFFQRAGFRRFAYCGFPGVFFSDSREAAFAAEMSRRHLPGHIFAPARTGESAGDDLFRRERRSGGDETGLREWISQLPRSVAILACNDIRGQQIINACREVGMSVPGDAAVLGIDNDEVICRLSRPTLSSIAQNTEGIGRLAAELLAARLDGGRAPGKTHFIPPLRIVERRSTDTVSADHPTVLAAARIIRDEFARGLSVKELCTRLHCSRSNLDPLFQKHLGRSISGEIDRVRLDHASRLLLDTDHPVADVAAQCGFSSATHFCRHFRSALGCSPGEFKAAGGPPRKPQGTP